MKFLELSKGPSLERLHEAPVDLHIKKQKTEKCVCMDVKNLGFAKPPPFVCLTEHPMVSVGKD